MQSLLLWFGFAVGCVMREREKTKSVGMAGEAGSLIVQSAAGREESRSTPPLLSVSFPFQRALQNAGATTQGFHTPRSVSSAWERNFDRFYIFFFWMGVYELSFQPGGMALCPL